MYIVFLSFFTNLIFRGVAEEPSMWHYLSLKWFFGYIFSLFIILKYNIKWTVKYFIQLWGGY
jgi:hypothetical protein